MRKEIENKIKEVISHNINHQLGLMGMQKCVESINMVDAICKLVKERLEKIYKTYDKYPKKEDYPVAVEVTDEFMEGVKISYSEIMFKIYRLLTELSGESDATN